MYDILNQADKHAYTTSTGAVAYYADVTATGPSLTDYQTNTIDLRIETGDSNLPFGRYVWQIAGLSITGYNPISS